ncbi:MAG: hypothetical protein O1I87_14940 [Cylindrospermopsis raciborskii PAMP2012]|nr:hypothetical protein [Cylindrospermopsis raciborskii PAMP2012]
MNILSMMGMVKTPTLIFSTLIPRQQQIASIIPPSQPGRFQSRW